MTNEYRGDYWAVIDCQQFVVNFFQSQQIDDPLNLVLRKVFTEMISKLMFYSGCTSGVHIFSNTLFSEKGKLGVFEIDWLPVSTRNAKYVIEALIARQSCSSQRTSITNLPTYRNLREIIFDRALGLNNALKPLVESRFPIITHCQDWQWLFARMNEETQHQAREHEETGTRDERITCNAEKLLAVPLAIKTDQFLCGNLGLVLLWNNQKAFSDDEWQQRQDCLRHVAKTLGAAINRFLTVHYQITPSTYLPQYKRSGERSVAVMFADIRNFTPTTEVLRNFRMVGELMRFMRMYCDRMSEIIAAHGGRVQAYAGDGIMAIFGEYMTSEEKAVESAKNAAIKMCKAFDEIKRDFKERPEVETFFQSEYETLDFSLGIGINFGPVIFEYFGSANNRTYTPLGDHVNFAQRLESGAGRPDPALQRFRAPILLSRPVWRRLGKPDSMKPVLLEVKGKPSSYEAYECFPE